MKSIYDKTVDVLMFREGSDEDSNSRAPIITTGSIVWGVLLRATIVLIAFFFLMDSIRGNDYWWVSLFFIWAFVAFPAYRQYEKYAKRIENFAEETLCGSCKHFNKGAQSCNIYDEHVSKDYIPCEGESWEPY
ncbi:MAG: hypothetical protein M9949_11915 [Candidatus Kapabacteria bacterium]|nr:hypothetical protein [Candidatus Kapabacteria bacterium]